MGQPHACGSVVRPSRGRPPSSPQHVDDKRMRHQSSPRASSRKTRSVGLKRRADVDAVVRAPVPAPAAGASPGAAPAAVEERADAVEEQHASAPRPRRFGDGRGRRVGPHRVGPRRPVDVVDHDDGPKAREPALEIVAMRAGLKAGSGAKSFFARRSARSASAPRVGAAAASQNQVPRLAKIARSRRAGFDGFVGVVALAESPHARNDAR